MLKGKYTSGVAQAKGGDGMGSNLEEVDNESRLYDFWLSNPVWRQRHFIGKWLSYLVTAWGRLGEG
jgi:hypothetical protein